MKDARPLLVRMVLALAASLVGTIASAHPIGSLPARYLVIDGGLVAVQVALDGTSTKKPPRYALFLTNETERPIWLKLEWTVPGQKPFSSFGKATAGERVTAWVDAAKAVTWDQEIAVEVEIFGDEAKEHRLGGREVTFSFDRSEEAEFTRKTKRANRPMAKIAQAHGKPGELPIVAGFRDIDLAAPVPGSGADEEELALAKLYVTKLQSIGHWGCRHHVLDAGKLDPRADLEDLELMCRILEGGLPAYDPGAREQPTPGRSPCDDDPGARERLGSAIESGDLRLEEWRVESCDQVVLYRVILRRHPEGGSMVSVVALH